MDSVVVPRHLLLLTPPPWPPSQEALRSAYTGITTSALTQISAEIAKATAGASLDIAVALPWLYDYRDQPRSRIYSPVQAVLAGIYKLICVIAARENINVEDNEGIDISVLLLAIPQTQDSAEPSNETTRLGPVISLKTLAHSERSWQTVYATDGDNGHSLIHGFLALHNKHMHVRRVPGGQIAETTVPSIEEVKGAQYHSSIAVGGTWDHIHIGHKLLLTMFAFVLQQQSSQDASLTIGITGDELLKNKKYAEILESWQDRQQSVTKFLRAIMDFRSSADSKLSSRELYEPGPNGHAIHHSLGDDVVLKMVEIADPFGPTITDETITSLVLSVETRSGGNAVNDKRKEQGWQPLEVFEVDVLDAREDTSTASEEAAFASKLSSTDIRKKVSEKGKIRSKA